MHSLLLACAEQCALPAGGALAVDRDAFSQLVTSRLTEHPNIRIIRKEVTEVPSQPSVIATGPLTSPAFANALQQLMGSDCLFFYDAIAPIVTRDSINMDIVFTASRYLQSGQDAGDYLNCPFTKEQYEDFVAALCEAQRIELKEFEREISSGVTAGAEKYFEGCLPVEVLARRGVKSLAFGPMKPVGLRDPRMGKRPYAVVQLRQENLAASLYNLVGFQTNLTFPEQKKVFRKIPGLEKAEFSRFGQMHRNLFITSPQLLQPSLQLRSRPDLLLAGQITGVEGYIGNIATGLLAGWNAARLLCGEDVLELPRNTMLGSLCHYITHAEAKTFQPMKANLGILPMEAGFEKMGKRERATAYSHILKLTLQTFLQENH